jgi:methylglutaconyl-CoA hydratase
MGDVLRVRREGPREVITLARPEVHNALNEELIGALDAAFQEAADSDARLVVLAADGASFCAGADLAWMQRAAQLTPEENRADAARLAAMIRSIAGCPKPVIARVQGAALGGGVGLVAACDLAVAAPQATFGLSEVRLGLAPSVIFPFLLRKIARHHLLEAALTGDRFPAARALQMGLVNEVSSDLDAVIDRWAASLLAAGPDALAAVKALFAAVPQLPPEAARAFTADLIARLRAGEEAREGIRAFLERRAPSWAPPRNAGR